MNPAADLKFASTVATTPDGCAAPRSEFDDLLDGCTGLDDPTYLAATLLADAWAPALDRSYRIGFENGYSAGFYEAESEMAAAWRRAARPIQAVLRQPTHAEMAARRHGSGSSIPPSASSSSSTLTLRPS